MKRESYPILAIIGPTACGKSALALSLAQTLGAEILSVDSMQVYRGMDIGTAKPTPQQQQNVPHHLLDVVNPDKNFNVAKFVPLADAVIEDAQRRGVRLIATGGTPMYFKSLFHGLFEGPSADESVRQELGKMESEKMHEALRKIDAAAAQRIHAADRRRLIRALEVHQITGKPISSLQNQWDENSPPRHPAIWIGLKWEKDALNRRINARVGEMMSVGWPLEVRKRIQDYPQLSQTAGEATGYKELIRYARGELDLDDAAEKIKIATRQLARRQMKWFRRFPRVHWLAGDLPPQTLLDSAREIWIGGA